MAAAPVTGDYQKTAEEIDRRLEKHWMANNLQPAAVADDATLARRVTLDLVGRIPTRSEWEAHLAKGKSSDERYQELVRQLLDGPEFALHFGAVLDEIIQGTSAGNADFVDYLRRGVRERKAWDAIFRELMLGPWDTPESKPAGRFLETRAKDLDRLTTDATRAFFGVDISCARCHDHPLVPDWKQDHYYGMASFFNRTGGGGKGGVGEKYDGEVSFKTRDGTQRTAALMFLSGRVVEEPPPEEAKKAKFSRREQLVKLALEEKTLLSRALVNRLWQRFFGRGLVSPVDQLHSANSPSIPGLLEWLAEDFASSGFDLHRLSGAIVSSRAYRLSSRWEQDAMLPGEEHFAVARLRLLSPRQYSLSALVAAQRAEFAPLTTVESRVERIAGAVGVTRIEQYLATEQTAVPLAASLDPALDGQSSTAEALFFSNHSAAQAVVRAEGKSLAARLAEMSDNRKVAETAIRHIFCRPPVEAELDRLAAWIADQQQDRARTCEQLVWALITSAEFRFQH